MIVALSTTIVVILVAAGVLAVALLLAVTRRPKLDGGLDSWRRHIDALSPESRREVIERVRDAENRRRDDSAERGS